MTSIWFFAFLALLVAAAIGALILLRRAEDREADLRRALQEKETTAAPTEREGIGSTIVDELPLGILVHDRNSEIIDCNSRAAALLESSREHLLGRSFDDPEWSLRREDGSELPADQHPVARVLASRRPVRDVVLGLQLPDRWRARWLLFNAEPKIDDEGTVDRVVLTIQDISREKRLEKRTETEKHFDPVTSCFNRSYLPLFERSAWGDRQRWGCIVVLVDGLQEINRDHGHETGDRALELMARFLMMQVRSGEAVVRIGGAEFLLLVAGVDAGSLKEIVEEIEGRARDEAPMPFSIGWASREDEEPVESTLARAERGLRSVEVLQRFPGRRVQRF
ncbi:MAG: diguanylate cyclase [Thermoanaerobaculia bacterium]|nr:diguanylate cyclase [Thermoanaerobaculia bacterium]